MAIRYSDLVTCKITYSLENSSFYSVHAVIKGDPFQSRVIIIIYKKDFSYDLYIEHDDNFDNFTILQIRTKAKYIVDCTKSGAIKLPVVT